MVRYSMLCHVLRYGCSVVQCNMVWYSIVLCIVCFLYGVV